MTDKRGWTFFLGCAVVSVPAFLIDSLPLKEGKASDLQSVEGTQGEPNEPPLLALAPTVLSTGQGLFYQVWGETRLVALIASDPNSVWGKAPFVRVSEPRGQAVADAPHPQSKSAPVRDKPGVAASPVGAAARYKSVKRKLTVYGNGDGYLGRRTADETRYTKDGFWVAYNEAPLGSTVKVDAEYTCDKGHKNLNTESLLVKDRTAKKLKGIVIDATLKAWLKLMWCETCGKCKPYGKHYVTVRRIK